ncbi:MAG: alpha/beta hydrolase [Pygmaiobacter sp.]|nr:alpha/beta hydrolase [Pygmaiobacter sp.]
MKGPKYDALVQSLSQGAVVRQLRGTPVELRSCADRREGEVDPRTAAAAGLNRAEFLRDKYALDPELWANEEHLFGPKDPQGLTPLELLRVQFGWVSSDLSCGIRTLRRSVQTPAGPVPVWQYELLTARTDRPCVVFFHGGGFFAGIIPTVENQCKLLAQLMGGVVLAVDYPLAPEHPYPAGFDACYAALCWAHGEAEELGISPDKIGVMGDSAGGNLALACALRDRDEGAGRVGCQVLIYPTLSRSEGPQDGDYFFDEALYHNPHGDALIDEQIHLIGSMAHQTNAWYLPAGQNARVPYLHPLAAPCTGLPQTLLLTAEYDFLYAECEEYTRRLQAAGVPVRHIRYGGIFHGTFDRLGYAPQVEDMLLCAAQAMRAL